MEGKDMNERFVKGIDYKIKGAGYKTYVIDDNGTDLIESHGSKIEVFGDRKLRDKIIKFLNEDNN
jgi:hypothetical protein